jgi:putative phosphoesterase
MSHLAAVISDTHLPRAGRRLPDACLAWLQAAELIVHAGDVCGAAVLEDLRAVGPPVAAVHGNVDEPALRASLPERLVLSLGSVSIGLVHDAGPAQGRLERLRGRFPECAAVIFGHSHIPLHERAGAFQIFNPGSPTDRRRQPQRTMGLARVDERAVTFELVALGR